MRIHNSFAEHSEHYPVSVRKVKPLMLFWSTIIIVQQWAQCSPIKPDNVTAHFAIVPLAKKVSMNEHSNLKNRIQFANDDISEIARHQQVYNISSLSPAKSELLPNSSASSQQLKQMHERDTYIEGSGAGPPNKAQKNKHKPDDSDDSDDDNDDDDDYDDYKDTPDSGSGHTRGPKTPNILSSQTVNPYKLPVPGNNDADIYNPFRRPQIAQDTHTSVVQTRPTHTSYPITSKPPAFIPPKTEQKVASSLPASTTTSAHKLHESVGPSLDTMSTTSLPVMINTYKNKVNSSKLDSDYDYEEEAEDEDSEEASAFEDNDTHDQDMVHRNNSSNTDDKQSNSLRPVSANVAQSNQSSIYNYANEIKNRNQNTSKLDLNMVTTAAAPTTIINTTVKPMIKPNAGTDNERIKPAIEPNEDEEDDIEEDEEEDEDEEVAEDEEPETPAENTKSSVNSTNSINKHDNAILRNEFSNSKPDFHTTPTPTRPQPHQNFQDVSRKPKFTTFNANYGYNKSEYQLTGPQQTMRLDDANIPKEDAQPTSNSQPPTQRPISELSSNNNNNNNVARPMMSRVTEKPITNKIFQPLATPQTTISPAKTPSFVHFSTTAIPNPILISVINPSTTIGPIQQFKYATTPRMIPHNMITNMMPYDRSSEIMNDDGLTRQIYDKTVEVYQETERLLRQAWESVWPTNMNFESGSFEPLLAQPLLFMCKYSEFSRRIYPNSSQ